MKMNRKKKSKQRKQTKPNFFLEDEQIVLYYKNRKGMNGYIGFLFLAPHFSVLTFLFGCPLK